MFKSASKCDVLIVLMLIITILLVGYYYVNRQARNQLWLKTYPVRAQLALTHVSCSDNSPSWLRDIIRYQTKYNNAPANQIAYIDSQNNLYHCESGYIGQYPLLSERVSTATRFRYASVSKLWTSDAILDLVKQGQVKLDSPLSEYLSEIEQPSDRRIHDITVRSLLLHRAGFDRNSVMGHDMFGIGEPICPYDIQKLNNIKLSFAPDTMTSYSNLGYCLLGEVISRTANKSFVDVIHERYQLSNNSLKYIENKPLPDEVTYNYVETGLLGVGDIYKAFDYRGLASAAGLSGNAIDLATSVRTMADKPKPNIISGNDHVDCDDIQIAECYGYAMIAYQDTATSPMVYYRDGALLGLSSLVAIDEQRGTVALLSNGTPDDGLVGNNKVKMMIYKHLNSQ